MKIKNAVVLTIMLNIIYILAFIWVVFELVTYIVSKEPFNIYSLYTLIGIIIVTYLTPLFIIKDLDI